MSDLTVFPADLAAMSVSQLANLPPAQLAEADANLDHLIDWAKKTRTKLDAALDQRFGEQGRPMELTLGKEPLGDPALVEDLDRPRVQAAGPRPRQLLHRAALEDGDLDLGQRQLTRQHQTGRPAADDHHRTPTCREQLTHPHHPDP